MPHVGFNVWDQALVGTTFVISAAFYQSYLVRFRGWKTDQLRAGLVDARFGAVIMMVLTLMIITTAAAVPNIPPRESSRS